VGRVVVELSRIRVKGMGYGKKGIEDYTERKQGLQDRDRNRNRNRKGTRTGAGKGQRYQSEG